MNIWFRRLLLVLTIGGSFAGVVTTMNAVLTATKAPAVGYCVMCFFVLLYAYGIFAGLRLSENASHYGHVMFFFSLQVPFFSSPLIVYRFTCGADATIAIVGLGFAWMLRLGGDWQLALLQANLWGLGVNLFAAAILFALTLHFRKERPVTEELKGVSL